MTDNEKKAMEELKMCKTCAYNCTESCLCEIDFNTKRTLLNLISKQQKEIEYKDQELLELTNSDKGKMKQENEKLKSHNKDLLRKLRNRVKEVKKLNKEMPHYKQYKVEFKNLNNQLQLKDKVIDDMSEELEATAEFLDEEGIIMGNYCFHKKKEEIKQYFINKAKEEM